MADFVNDDRQARLHLRCLHGESHQRAFPNTGLLNRESHVQQPIGPAAFFDYPLLGSCGGTHRLKAQCPKPSHLHEAFGSKPTKFQ